MMKSARLALLLLVTVFAHDAVAQNFETETDTSKVRAVPTVQPAPSFPGGDLRTGQEGWVRINFIVSDDGRAIDPIIVDSVGGEPFETAALQTLNDWRFEPAASGEEIGNNQIDMRFEIYRGRELATSNFMRRYRRIVTHLFNEETTEARYQTNQAVELGGWNLYESVMLNLMVGRVEGQEGDLAEKLEFYRRALGVASNAALNGKDRRDVLSRIFEAEHSLGQYGSALQTAEALAAERASKSALQARIDEIKSRIANESRIVAKCQLAAACDCASGRALSVYQPARQQFSFANLEGEVRNFEIRCDASRTGAPVETGRTYSLPADGENCSVYVFGDDGARFDLIEAGNEPLPDDDAVSAVVDNRAGYR